MHSFISEKKKNKTKKNKTKKQNKNNSYLFEDPIASQLGALSKSLPFNHMTESDREVVTSTGFSVSSVSSLTRTHIRPIVILAGGFEVAG